MSDNNDEEQREAKYKKKGKCVKDEDNFRNVVYLEKIRVIIVL